MRGILFIGGSGPAEVRIRRIVRPGDLLCAADSGLEAALNAGIRPELVVGDMDSLSDPALLEDYPADRVEIHPVDKDETDTELGIRRLVESGCDSIILIGGGEGRLDHTLALRSLFDGLRSPDLWYTSREEIRRVEGNLDVQGRPGMNISFFSSGNGPWEVNSSGLKWPLDGVDWAAGDLSLSNRLEKSTAEIRVRSGRLIQIRPIGDVFQAD